MRTCALLLVVTVSLAALASAYCRPAQAATQTPPPPKTTVAATCDAAHDADSRVSVTFCTTNLRDAYAPDTCFLAAAAAAVGISNANAARREIVAEMQQRDDEQEDDPIYRSLLMRCEGSYSVVREKYEAAREAIAEQRYGDVEEELSSVPWRGQSCDDEFALARLGGVSPFAQYSENNTQIVFLTRAITSLIKSWRLPLIWRRRRAVIRLPFLAHSCRFHVWFVTDQYLA